MNIGKAANLSDLTVKTVRYYSDIGLIKPQIDTNTGYRNFSEFDLAKLQFLAKARKFDFSLNDCRELLALYENTERSSKEVKALTLEKIAKIDTKLSELQMLRDQLSTLATACHGDDRPNCPILDALSEKTN
ncbi:MAG: Cu(I)-responsive transcriptional regulator [Magnetovibrio sp.]|nr:Cu(I)-responsive transcriptional regulator [Magnetovibrio sp.]|tara:strand:+ start:534 stop:929 length:396 start_codon:yes stop_codon:yes gene_type:complete